MPYDEKYDFRGGVFHKGGNYFLPEDEPVFLIRGKDQMGLRAIRAYVKICEEIARDMAESDHVRKIAQEHADSAYSQQKIIEEWQFKNGEKVGAISYFGGAGGCHTCKISLKRQARLLGGKDSKTN